MLLVLLACTSPCGRGTHDSKGLCVADDDTGGNLDSADADTDADNDTDADSDTDTDADSDTDADTDSDSDTDTDTAPTCDVAADGSATYTDIQAAVDDAADGDTIYVCAGTYAYVDIERHDVSIVGVDGAHVTVIDGGAHPAVNVVDRTVSLSGLTLTGTTQYAAAWGLNCSGATLTVSDVRLADAVHDGRQSYGMLLTSCTSTLDRVEFADNDMSGEVFWAVYGDLTLRHSTFHDNTNSNSSGDGGSIVVYLTQVNAEVSNNLIYNNEGSAVATTSTSQWVYNNVIYGNSGQAFDQQQPGDVENNIIAGNTYGVGAESGASFPYSDIWNDDGEGEPATGSIIADPKFTDPGAGDFTLTGFSPCVDMGNPIAGYNDVDGTRNDMGAFGGPYGDWAP